MKTVTIAIPTYEMNGKGTLFLKRSFDILTKQSFKDFDVVVSDHSNDVEIENLCKEYGIVLNIHYIRNEADRGNSSANINNAITKATGLLIKILFQDDFLYSEQSLALIVDNFDLEKDHWLVTGCNHTIDGISFFKPHYPVYNQAVYLGKNTVGAPSVLTIKNENRLLFDKNLAWLMDCDYYKKCYDTFGKPKILNEITVSIGLGDHQVTNTGATEVVRYREFLYSLKKYGASILSLLYIIRTFSIYYIKKIIRKFT